MHPTVSPCMANFLASKQGPTTSCLQLLASVVTAYMVMEQFIPCCECDVGYFSL